MYAWGSRRINEQKHPEIAWAADTYYLSHLAATLDNQPVLSSPWQMLQECQRGHSKQECVRACVALSGSAMLRNVDHGISLPEKTFWQVMMLLLHLRQTYKNEKKKDRCKGLIISRCSTICSLLTFLSQSHFLSIAVCVFSFAQAMPVEVPQPC